MAEMLRACTGKASAQRIRVSNAAPSAARKRALLNLPSAAVHEEFDAGDET
jgi:hypothetical protein